MGFYLSIMWAIYAAYGILFLISLFLKNKKLRKFLDDYALLTFMVGASFLIMALITNDPVTVAGYTMPTELQWLGSLLVTGFGAWKFYLNPLKQKVYTMDREIGEIKMGIEKVEKNVDKLLSNKIEQK